MKHQEIKEPADECSIYIQSAGFFRFPQDHEHEGRQAGNANAAQEGARFAKRTGKDSCALGFGL